MNNPLRTSEDYGVFLECDTVEQMILDAAAKLGGKSASVLHWNTKLLGTAIAADFCLLACYTSL